MKNGFKTFRYGVTDFTKIVVKNWPATNEYGEIKVNENMLTELPGLYLGEYTVAVFRIKPKQ